MQIQGKYRCINCFNEINNPEDICNCGYNQSQYRVKPHWLYPGTILDGRYYIGRVLGAGGFGITYVGYDVNLDRKVAIKEFYINGINSRNTTISNNIEVGVDDRDNLFETYRKKFINEAQILAKVQASEGVVSVINFFSSNNTAYIIMEFLDGETLGEYLQRKNTLTVEETLNIFLPIMGTLEQIHSLKLIHRDISPDNIIFTKEGKVKLLDFGAARDISDANKSLSIVLKHGYAPQEQYQTHGRQGAWTDVYALSATMYKCLTGIIPTEASARAMGGGVNPVNIVNTSCPKEVSDVIMKGLAFKIEDRYQTMGELAQDLVSAYKYVTQRVGQAQATKEIGQTHVPEHDTQKKSSVLPIILTVILLCLVAGIGGLIFANKDRLTSSEEVETNTGSDSEPGGNSHSKLEDTDYAYLLDAKVGDIVEFGDYKGYTKWRVVEKTNGTIMLITDEIVEYHQYNNSNIKTEWKNCSLRKWLNNDFYENAFSEEEKELINNTIVDDGKDKVFVASRELVEKLFSNKSERVFSYKGTPDCWWLRDDSKKDGDYNYAYGVAGDGEIYDFGVDFNMIGVCPMITIDLY